MLKLTKFLLVLTVLGISHAESKLPQVQSFLKKQDVKIRLLQEPDKNANDQNTSPTTAPPASGETAPVIDDKKKTTTDVVATTDDKTPKNPETPPTAKQTPDSKTTGSDSKTPSTPTPDASAKMCYNTIKTEILLLVDESKDFIFNAFYIDDNVQNSQAEFSHKELNPVKSPAVNIAPIIETLKDIHIKDQEKKQYKFAVMTMPKTDNEAFYLYQAINSDQDFATTLGKLPTILPEEGTTLQDFSFKSYNPAIFEYLATSPAVKFSKPFDPVTFAATNRIIILVTKHTTVNRLNVTKRLLKCKDFKASTTGADLNCDDVVKFLEKSPTDFKKERDPTKPYSLNAILVSKKNDTFIDDVKSYIPNTSHVDIEDTAHLAHHLTDALQKIVPVTNVKNCNGASSILASTTTLLGFIFMFIYLLI